MEINIRESEKYIQIDDLTVADLERSAQFWQDIKSEYAGFQIDFCYKNTEPAVDFLHEAGAVLIESSIETRLKLEGYLSAGRPAEDHPTERRPAERRPAEGGSLIEGRLPEGQAPGLGNDIIKVTETELKEFVGLHDRCNPDMFWTGDRIARDLGKWCIYMLGDNYVLMSLWADAADVYALEVSDVNTGIALLSAAVEYAQSIGKNEVVMFVDEDAVIEIEAVRALGFAECGRFKGYRGVV